jgi:predicted metal-dependent enzyme (double-stranded beta helix superfamily)
METMLKNLNETLENLKKENVSFNEVVENLFSYSFEDYNEIFKINQIEVPEKTYKRLPVFNNDNCVAILMLWGNNNKTAVHDHKNYEGKIKVLKGELTEVYYKETEDFIEYEGAGVAVEGLIFDEELGGIHSIVNNKNVLSVSLHIYKTSELNLSGVRIFDTEKKKWAVLTDKAPSCSWNLPDEAFEKVVNL